MSDDIFLVIMGTTAALGVAWIALVISVFV